jgi:membrane-associated phospholipid phosphatase
MSAVHSSQNKIPNNKNVSAMTFSGRLIVVLALLATSCTPEANAQNLDVNILKGINPRYPNSQVWIQTSNSVYFVPISIAAAQMAYGMIANDKRSRDNSLQTLLSVGIGVVASQAMKSAFNRTRPQYKYSSEIFSLSKANTKSFPSGHTTMAFATATTLTLEYKKWYIAVPAYAWATGVAYSRMYEGKHYPSDVLAGAVLGAGSALLSHWLSKKLFK